jgi:hypothetical protein
MLRPLGLRDVEDPTLFRQPTGGEVISLMYQPRSTGQKHFYFCLGYSLQAD